MRNKSELARCPRLALSVAIGSLAAGMALGDTAFVSGEWGVKFVAEGSTLRLSHAASGVVPLALSFEKE